VILAGGLIAAGCGAATNGCAVECCVRVITRSIFALTGTSFTINGSWDACSVPCMTLDFVICLMAVIIFFGFSLIDHGFLGFGLAMNGRRVACSVFPTCLTLLGATDLIRIAVFDLLFFGGFI
jgi:hypothetical protein